MFFRAQFQIQTYFNLNLLEQYEGPNTCDAQNFSFSVCIQFKLKIPN